MTLATLIIVSLILIIELVSIGIGLVFRTKMVLAFKPLAHVGEELEDLMPEIKSMMVESTKREP